MFLLLLLLVHQWSVALFRMMGALCRNIVVANAVGLMFMLLVFLMGGFVITKQSIQPWVVWMYWVSPMQVLSHQALAHDILFTTPQEAFNKPTISQSVIKLWRKVLELQSPASHSNMLLLDLLMPCQT